MAVFRFLSGIFMLLAVIALVADLTPTLTSGAPFEPSALSLHWTKLGPASLAAVKAAVEASSPWAWENLVAPLIGQPTFAIFGVLALLSGYAGRRRHRINIYVN